MKARATRGREGSGVGPRGRLLPLVTLMATLAAFGTPLAVLLSGLAETRAQSSATAQQVATVLQRELQHDVALWRYNSSKIVRELRAFRSEAEVVRVAVVDGAGRLVPTGERGEGMSASLATVWGSAPIRLAGQTVGAVWVGTSAAGLYGRAAVALLALAVVGFGLAGWVYRVSWRAQEQIRSISSRAVALEERQRRAISRDLHDGVGQAITAARINVQLMASSVEGDGAVARRTIELLDDALDEVRSAVSTLTPRVLDEVGLRAALERFCRDFSERTGVAVACQLAESLPALPSPVETACYRVVQEALTNVARHAEATQVTVDVRVAGGALTIRVGDDGRGLGDSPGEGSGMGGIRERACLLGGSASWTSPSPCGTRLEVVLPVEDAALAQDDSSR